MSMNDVMNEFNIEVPDVPMIGGAKSRKSPARAVLAAVTGLTKSKRSKSPKRKSAEKKSKKTSSKKASKKSSTSSKKSAYTKTVRKHKCKDGRTRSVYTKSGKEYYKVKTATGKYKMIAIQRKSSSKKSA